jgi:hypothetical protein
LSLGQARRGCIPRLPGNPVVMGRSGQVIAAAFRRIRQRSLPGVTGVNEVSSQTPHRPRVRGLTAPEFDNVGTPDLRFWLRWWSDPERDPSGDEEAGRDPLEEQRKIKAEIEAREKLGVAGPNRDRTWTQED